MDKFRQRLSQNTLALLVSNAGSAGLSFLLSVMIGRVLGQSDFGVYATVLAWIFPLSLIAEFGLGTLITRDIASDHTLSHAYLRASVIARLIIGLSLITSIWLFAPFISQDIDVISGIRIASPLIIILPLYSSFTAIFRAQQVMMPIAFLNLGMLISQVILTALAFSVGADILVILTINTLTSLGQLLSAWGVYRRRFYQPTQLPLSHLNLLRHALPFAIAAILAAIQARVTIILLEQFTSTASVGAYAASARFIEAGRLIPHAFFDALFPVLAGLATTPQRLRHFFRRILLGLIAFGVLFGIGVSLIARPLILWSYGDTFSDAIGLLVILAWSLLPMLLKGGRTLYWYALGQEMFVNRVTALVIMLQVGVSMWLIPQYGAMGAVWTIIIAESSAMILLFTRRS